MENPGANSKWEKGQGNRKRKWVGTSPIGDDIEDRGRNFVTSAMVFIQLVRIHGSSNDSNRGIGEETVPELGTQCIERGIVSN